jgi:hypothetical protein
MASGNPVGLILLACLGSAYFMTVSDFPPLTFIFVMLGWILAVADQTDVANFFNGDDAVVLRRGSAVIDVIGQVCFDPGAAWVSGMTSTLDHTLRRKATVSTGDTNPNDPFGFDRTNRSGFPGRCGLSHRSYRDS